MKKITFVKNGMAIKLAYFAGDEVMMETKQADELIESGYAVEKEKVKPSKEKVDLPEDLPGRDVLLSHNINTVSEVKKIVDLTELQGIGKKTAEKIKAALK